MVSKLLERLRRCPKRTPAKIWLATLAAGKETSQMRESVQPAWARRKGGEEEERI